MQSFSFYHRDFAVGWWFNSGIIGVKILHTSVFIRLIIRSDFFFVFTMIPLLANSNMLRREVGYHCLFASH